MGPNGAGGWAAAWAAVLGPFEASTWLPAFPNGGELRLSGSEIARPVVPPDAPPSGPSRLSCATASGGRCDGQDLDAGGELPGQAEARAAAGDSWDVQTFLANKWRIDDTGAPLYALLSDAALAVVSLPSSRDRDAGAAHLAHELVALGRGAGLTLDDLRDLGERLQNELIAAIVQEAVASSPAAVAG